MESDSDKVTSRIKDNRCCLREMSTWRSNCSNVLRWGVAALIMLVLVIQYLYGLHYNDAVSANNRPETRGQTTQLISTTSVLPSQSDDNNDRLFYLGNAASSWSGWRRWVVDYTRSTGHNAVLYDMIQPYWCPVRCQTPVGDLCDTWAGSRDSVTVRAACVSAATTPRQPCNHINALSIDDITVNMEHQNISTVVSNASAYYDIIEIPAADEGLLRELLRHNSSFPNITAQLVLEICNMDDMRPPSLIPAVLTSLSNAGTKLYSSHFIIRKIVEGNVTERRPCWRLKFLSRRGVPGGGLRGADPLQRLIEEEQPAESQGSRGSRRSNVWTNLSKLVWNNAEVRLLQLLLPLRYPGRCAREVRFGEPQDGGWNACMEQLAGPDCLVYSFGLSSDWSFDEALTKVTGCELHGFDHTLSASMRAKDGKEIRPNLYYHNLGIATAEASAAHNGTKATRSIKEIMLRLGHEGRKLNMWKMDVEGAERGVLVELLGRDPTFLATSVMQLCVEVHGVSVDETPNIITGLHRAGLRIFNTHLNPFYAHSLYEICFTNVNL